MLVMTCKTSTSENIRNKTNMFKLILKHSVIINIGFILIFLFAYIQKDASDIVFISLSVLYVFCYLISNIVIYRKNPNKMLISLILLCLYSLIVGVIFIQVNNTKEKQGEVKMIEETL
jgi:hypothetical protein